MKQSYSQEGTLKDVFPNPGGTRVKEGKFHRA